MVRHVRVRVCADRSGNGFSRRTVHDDRMKKIKDNKGNEKKGVWDAG
jgi:hypothetical protein